VENRRFSAWVIPDAGPQPVDGEFFLYPQGLVCVTHFTQADFSLGILLKV
jgi:hypothetical protein